MIQPAAIAVEADRTAARPMNAQAHLGAEDVLRRAIDRDRAAGDTAGLPLLLSGMGWLLRDSNRNLEAVGVFLEALAVSRARGAAADELADRETALVLNLVHLGLFDEAAEHAGAAFELLPAMTNIARRLRVMNVIATAYVAVGRFSSARRLYMRILRDAKGPHGSERERRQALIDLGNCCAREAMTVGPQSHEASRLWRRLLRCCSAALLTCIEADDALAALLTRIEPDDVQAVLLNAVEGLAGLHRLDEAERLLSRVAPPDVSCEKPQLHGLAVRLRAHIAFERRHYGAAAMCFEEAVRLSDPIATREEIAGLLERLSQAAERDGDLAKALDAQRRAADMRREMSRTLRQARLRIVEVRQELASTRVKREHALRTVAGVMHDIKQPVTALLSMAANGRLLLDQGNTEEVRDKLTKIASIAQRMNRLAGQLSTFARTGMVVLQTATVSEVLAHALSQVETRCREENVEVTVSQPSGPVSVVADPLQLRHVIVNLLRNGMEAMADSQRKRIDVHVEREDARVVISVRDHGCGIARQAMDCLFEPFSSDEPAGRGSGLGLPTSHHAILRFGGALKGQNAPGGGALFQVIVAAA